MDIPAWCFWLFGIVAVAVVLTLFFLNRLAHRLFGDALADLNAPLSPGEVARFVGHTAGVTSFDVSSDGTRLLSGSKDGTFRLWDVATQRLIRTYSAPSGNVMAVALSGDARRALFVANVHHAHYFRALLQTMIMIPKAFYQGLVGGNHDEAEITPKASKSCLYFWDLIEDRRLWQQKGESEFNSVNFSPDGKQAVVGCFDGSVIVWDIESNTERFRLHGHKSATNASFSRDGQRIATIGHMDRVAIVWEAATGRELLRIPPCQGNLFHVGFSPDSQEFVTTSGSFTTEGSECGLTWIDCAAVVYDLSGKVLARLVVEEEFVFHASFSTDGRRIVTAGGDKIIRLWNKERERETERWTGHSDIVTEVRFTADGRFVISSSRDGTLRKWAISD